MGRGSLSRGVGRGHGSDPAWLWLWRRPAATAPIQPTAWEPPYAAGVALKGQRQKKKKIRLQQQVTTEVQVQPQALHSGLKDLALLQLWLEFNPSLRNFHVPQVRPLKTNKKKI